jgi:hypothetical protein
MRGDIGRSAPARGVASLLPSARGDIGRSAPARGVASLLPSARGDIGRSAPARGVASLLPSARVATLLSLLTLMGCAGSDDGLSDAGPCPASARSGIWLLPFGPVAQEILFGGKANLTLAVTQSSDKEGEGKALQGHVVSLRVITPGGDAALEAFMIQSDADGLVQASLSSGTQEMVYQIEAFAEGTCPVTFTVDVRRPLRQLRAVTPSPFDTFTLSRVPMAVEASTNGNARLRGEDVEFSFKVGKTATTRLATTDGSQKGDKLTVKTNQVGRATVLLETGTETVSQLIVQATMAGTAPVEIVVRIAEGKSSGCKADGECPLSYTCKSGKCEPPPPPPPPTGCTSDADCAPPTVCQIATGQCLQPTGKNCDPVEGTGCAADEVCVGYTCAKVPSTCVDNSACPPGWICQGGACVPGGQPPTGGCKTYKDCPAGSTCIDGQCKPKSTCNIVHNADRLKGTWQYDSTMHFRDALGPVIKTLLTTSSILRDIIEGRFKISGIPSFISKLVSKYLKKLIDKYVPPWGQELIVTLGDIDDIVDDMRVLSTVQTSGVGNDSYVNSEQWDLVEFVYKGKKISSPPSAIPQIGQVVIPTYGSHEVCGVLFIDKHKVDNVIGGLVKWAIDIALSAATCSVPTVPCYGSVDQALQQTINCQALGVQLDKLVSSIWSSAPPIESLIAGACNSLKQQLIQTLTQELAALAPKLSKLELSGTVAIPNPPGDSTLKNGKWYGVLGDVIKGNFQGEFSAKR